MKRFNVTGLCLPSKHYMCDVSHKFERCKSLIEDGFYYAINFPRQYGKTSMQVMLDNEFEDNSDYFVISTSFEGIGDTPFESEEKMAPAALETFAKGLFLHQPELADYLESEAEKITTFKQLSRFLTIWIRSLDKKVILLIDEVDKASNNQAFLSFLAMLRDKYLLSKGRKDITFHSVVLLGVHDVKTLKLKLRSDDERKLNSPWNISKSLDVDFGFSVQEIAPMISDYADEHGFDMDIAAISKKLYYYTSGSPFLVSQMCGVIDEIIIPTEKRAWVLQDVEDAFKHLIDGDYTTTNFDDMDKNLENNEDLFNLVYKIVIQGEIFRFSISDPVIAKGKTYGILSQNSNGQCDVSNKIYEFRIIDYMLSKQKTNEAQLNLYAMHRFKEGGKLNVTLILQQFQLFLQEHNSSKDNRFLEKNGRLLLMSFLRPILNGKGFLFKENVTAEDRKMDLVITYNDKRYVIELKIWYGQKYLTDGIDQLCDYLDSYDLNCGHMLIYNFNANKQYETKSIQHRGKQITAVFV